MKQSRLEQFKDKILELKQCGYGSRYIGNLLGFGKSTINDFLKKIKNLSTKMQETTYPIVRH